LPVNVQFVNTSMSTGTASYFWDFGDGSNSTLASGVTHNYTSFGNFTVKLVQYDSAGSIDSINYVVNTALVGFGGGAASQNGANFQYLVSHSAPFTVNFNNQSINATEGYFWDFGDGTGSTTDSTNLTHIYSNSGFYLVKLVAFGTNSSDTATAAIQF
jgi:PKD repeat protein